MTDDRCPECDRPGCQMYRLKREIPSAVDRQRLARSECRELGAECYAHRVDWRARAMKAEAELREAKDTIEELKTNVALLENDIMEDR